jgi:hypothetical protein
MPVCYPAVFAIQPHVSAAAIQLTQTPLYEAVSECELAQTHGTPTNERPGRINVSVTECPYTMWQCIKYHLLLDFGKLIAEICCRDCEFATFAG